MRDSWVPNSVKRYSNYLSRLREKRKSLKAEIRKERPSRSRLTKKQRENILTKTNARCHICGGKINGEWHADHVLSYSKGGEHTVDNYLPAHKICNNYRWDYLAEEFQEILKLGVWARTQAERQTTAGKQIAEGFAKYENQKLRRRKHGT